MSAFLGRHAELAGGIFMYLCSGEMMPYPAATRVDLTDGVFKVREGIHLLASFDQNVVWCCSLSETSPSLG